MSKWFITISHCPGYIKLTPLSEYKNPKIEVVWVKKASSTRNEDFFRNIYLYGTNHQYMLFFTQKGKWFLECVFMKFQKVVIIKRKSNSKNLISIEMVDSVKAFILLRRS